MRSSARGIQLNSAAEGGHSPGGVGGLRLGVGTGRIKGGVDDADGFVEPGVFRGQLDGGLHLSEGLVVSAQHEVRTGEEYACRHVVRTLGEHEAKGVDGRAVVTGTIALPTDVDEIISIISTAADEQNAGNEGGDATTTAVPSAE